jgi:hypothetical protein
MMNHGAITLTAIVLGCLGACAVCLVVVFILMFPWPYDLICLYSQLSIYVHNSQDYYYYMSPATPVKIVDKVISD